MSVVRLPYHQWDAAKPSRHPDWNLHTRPVDIDIRTGLGLLRARARQLVQDSDHAKAFVRIVRNNIVGAPGFVLQSRAVMANGKPDQKTRSMVEQAWAAWGRRGVCEQTGKFTWRTLQRHVIEQVAIDGECFIRMTDMGAQGLSLHVIDAERIDVDHNGEYQGRTIRMGVELDSDRVPVAYWTRPEPAINIGTYKIGDRSRIPADEMLHVYLPEYTHQTRGVPWLATAAFRLHMLRGVEDAEVEAARASAAKFAAYEAKEWANAPEPAVNGQGQQLVDADGNPLSTDPGRFGQDLAPGSMEVVPYGYELKLLDPQHPNSAMPDFLKWGLRSVASGLGVSYNTLGNDAEGVNYTSLRFFLGVERDHWMEAQDWFESDFIQPVFDAWLDVAKSHRYVVGRPNRDSELAHVRWQPRRWEGPDPAKQANADKVELEIGSTTLTRICARKGIDRDDMLAERISELATIKQLAEASGLSLAEVLPHMAGLATAATTEPDQDVTDEQD